MIKIIIEILLHEKQNILSNRYSYDGSLLGENDDHILTRSIAHDFGSSKNTSVSQIIWYASLSEIFLSNLTLSFPLRRADDDSHGVM